MPSFLIDISLIVLFIVFLHIGFEAGFIRSLFAFAAGIISITLAKNYPMQEGINFYLVFFVSAIVVYLAGLFIVRVLKLFYLTLFDKYAGIILSICICFMFTVNFVLPQIAKHTNGIHTTVGNSIQKIYYNNVLPIIKKV